MAHVNEETDKSVEVFVQIKANNQIHKTVKAVEIITKLDRSFEQIIIKESEQANA